MEGQGAMPRRPQLKEYMNSLSKILSSAVLLSVGNLAQAKPLGKKCAQSILKILEGCQQIDSLEDFTLDKKSYTFALVDCKDGENITQQYALIEKLAGDSCSLRDVDTSFIDYMFGVSSDLKSNQPLKVYEAAIKAELRHSLKRPAARADFVEKLRARDKLGELTKDQIWVLKYLENEIKK